MTTASPPSASPSASVWFHRWTLLLQASIVGSALMALVLLWWPQAPVMTAYTADYARVFYGATALAEATQRHHDFLLGVVGAGVLGWAITLWFVVAGPWRRREPWAFRAVSTSVATWIVTDLVFSLLHGVHAEALFAGVASVGLLGPCLACRAGFSAAAATPPS